MFGGLNDPLTKADVEAETYEDFVRSYLRSRPKPFWTVYASGTDAASQTQRNSIAQWVIQAIGKHAASSPGIPRDALERTVVVVRQDKGVRTGRLRIETDDPTSDTYATRMRDAGLRRFGIASWGAPPASSSIPSPGPGQSQSSVQEGEAGMPRRFFDIDGILTHLRDFVENKGGWQQQDHKDRTSPGIGRAFPDPNAIIEDVLRLVTENMIQWPNGSYDIPNVITITIHPKAYDNYYAGRADMLRNVIDEGIRDWARTNGIRLLVTPKINVVRDGHVPPIVSQGVAQSDVSYSADVLQKASDVHVRVTPKATRKTPVPGHAGQTPQQLPSAYLVSQSAIVARSGEATPSGDPVVKPGNTIGVDRGSEDKADIWLPEDAFYYVSHKQGAFNHDGVRWTFAHGGSYPTYVKRGDVTSALATGEPFPLQDGDEFSFEGSRGTFIFRTE